MNSNTIKGWMSEKELFQLERWASEVSENGIIMEVGSYLGKSAIRWASACHPSVTVLCVDYFYIPNDDDDLYEEFCNNTKHFTNIKPIRAFSPAFKYSLYASTLLDIFFLDALHKNPNDWDNIEFGLKHLKTGGLLCGHDYDETWPDVIKNVHTLEDKLNQKATFYSDTSLWSFRV